MTSSVPRSLLSQGIREPARAYKAVTALARGWLVRLVCTVAGRRLAVGRNFRVIGWLDVKGPGQVVLGDNVVVDRTVTAWTYADDAVLSVGNDSYLNGTRFGCKSRITIGSRAILGDANIFDTDFHSTAANRWDKNASVRVRPITIANNVWVGSEAGILPGTSVGENSVVGFGAVCSGPFEANVIIAGNPARAVKNIPDAS